jgi:hypothetical protein
VRGVKPKQTEEGKIKKAKGKSEDHASAASLLPFALLLPFAFLILP